MGADSRLSGCMQAAAQAYVEHCAADPEHEVGLLALSVDFPQGDGDRWIAGHWTGKDHKVRRAPLPEGVDVRRLTGAVILERPDCNLIYFLAGRRAEGERWKLSMLVTPEDPQRLRDSDGWATRMIAGFAESLRTAAEPAAQPQPGRS